MILLYAALIIQLLSGTAAKPPVDFSLIAHAGGFADGYEGSNSLEALTASARRGYSLIEVDILSAEGGGYVLAHDWEFMSNRVPLSADKPVTAEVFSKYKIYGKYTAVTLEMLFEFLDKYKDVTIITDTKGADYGVLYLIADKFPQYINRFIPQVYDFSDYDKIKALGYDNIIVTVYSMPYEKKQSADWIYSEAARVCAYAVTIPRELLENSEYVSALRTDEVRYFTHTINDLSTDYSKLGIKGIYTDKLFFGSDGNLTEITDYKAKLAAALPIMYPLLRHYYRNLPFPIDESLIFIHNSGFCVNNGALELVGGNPVSGFFTDHEKGTIYLPLHKALPYLGGENGVFLHSEKRYTFTYDGITFALKIGGDSYDAVYPDKTETHKMDGEAVIYRDYIFLPSSFYESVFGCKITKVRTDIAVYTNANARPLNSPPRDYAQPPTF